MRAEVDLLLTHGASGRGRRVRPAGASDMDHEFSNECRTGASRSRVSAQKSRYMR
jgi:hypothetical protein